MAQSSPLASLAMMPSTLFNARAIRAYILRLPFFTRLTVLIILVFYLLEFQSVWSVIQWGSLTPSKLWPSGMHRLNTFPLIHVGFFHMLVDTTCLVPLLERFEGEFGTLVSLALFLGPFGAIPGVAYAVIEAGVLRADTPVIGSSIWVFLLLGAEAIKTYRANPFFEIASYKIPTWITPLAIIIVTSILIPNTSFLGHLCGCGVGYLWGLGYIRFLAPPERVLRWVEGKLNLLGRLPHYVSVDQKTYGRYGVLPTTSGGAPVEHNVPIGMGWLGNGGGQRLGP